MHRSVTPDSPSSLRRALGVVGMVLATVAVVAAGAAGWFGVERFVLADGGSDGTSLGAVGDGLPTERLDPPAEPWRRFEVTLRFTDREHRVALDLDAQAMRFRILEPDVAYDFVARADAGHERTDGEWVALTPDQTAAQSQLFVQDVGPFLLTDIVPPAALPYTTLLSDTMDGELRVFDVAIDAASFRLADPLGHERWLAASGAAADGPARRVVHVRRDGYVVRIDRAGSTRSWTEVETSILADSPLDALPGSGSGSPAEAVTQ